MIRTGKWLAFTGTMAVLTLAGCGASERAPAGDADRSALAGSSFESQDGNLLDQAAIDWQSAPNFDFKADPFTGSQDDAFGQGAKEDIPNPTVVTGSIPPNKSDLTRFYLGHERIGGDYYLYLAWLRTNILGSANMDFEFNQSSTLDDNGVTLKRTRGDLLVTFDFTNGGGNPVLGILRWLTPPQDSVASCFASNSLPCWGNHQTLGSATADGSVFPQVTCKVDADCAAVAPGALCNGPKEGNSKTCTTIDPKNGNATVNELTFGEAAINLTAAGVFSSNQCTTFAGAYLKSRSSASFTAELKDFIPPLSTNITNCATVDITKTDDLGAPLAGVEFTLYQNNAPVTTTPPHGAEDTATAYTCTTGANGKCSITNVVFGDYWAVETKGLTGYDLAANQAFTLDQNTPNGTVSLTFVDPRQPGAILVTKTAKTKLAQSGSAPQAGVTIGLYTNATPPVFITSGVTDANGQVCFDGLTPLGTTYKVVETVPSNYSNETATKTVTVTKTANCGALVGDADTVSFTNVPLSRITVSFQSLAGLGVTEATINCTGDTPGNYVALPEATPRILDDLVPGTYQCTVIVDP